MPRRLFCLLSCLPLLAGVAAAQSARPKIRGLAHTAFYVSDLAKTRAFYTDLLGFSEPFLLRRPDGTERITFIKVNEDQYVELFTDPPRGDFQLAHVALITDNAAAMRDYLAAKGIRVPERVGKGQTGNSNFMITDPDGHLVEIVQYEPDSWTRREQGKFIPESRVSTRMMHAGFLVADLDTAMKFYGGLLGFREIWRGSSNGQQLSWVNMQVPDGADYVEFMLYEKAPDKAQAGVRNHICLEVPDLDAAVAALRERAARAGYTRPIEIRTGTNRKRQANLFDPDGTRVELMEPRTVDGKPAPSSNAPAPKGEKHVP